MTAALLYKAVNPDLISRNDLRWKVGSTVTHPTSTEMVRDEPSTYLSLSTEPAETLIGPGWPARLLRVEPLSEVITSDSYPHKRCALSARVVDEIEAWRVFGPNGEAVVALIERCKSLPARQLHDLAAAWHAAGDAAGIAAWGAAWDAAKAAARAAARVAAWNVARVAARAAAWNAAWGAAWDASGVASGVAAAALVARDQLSDGHFETLTAPWVSVMGLL